VLFRSPECTAVTGILWYYPEVAAKFDIRQVDVPRPRPEVVALVGEENQSCPVLVLPAGETPAGVPVAHGRAFVSGPEAIIKYLAEHYGTAQ
jgi:hypothetical protein